MRPRAFAFNPMRYHTRRKGAGRRYDTPANRYMNKASIAKTILIGVAVLALLAAAVYAASLIPGIAGLLDPARIVQAIVIAVATVMTAYIAQDRLQIFRTFEPHLTIEQQVSHRRIGESYIHIGVTAVLQNNSKVKVEVREAHFRLSKIAPIQDDDIENLYDEVFVSNEFNHIQWELLYNVSRTWIEDEFVIEPNGTHREPFEFIVSANTQSILVHTYFHNSSSQNSAEGWGATTFYDILETQSVDSESV